MAGTAACGSEDRPGPAAENGLAGLSGAEVVARTQAAGAGTTSVRMTLRGDSEDGSETATVSAARNGDCTDEVTGGNPIEDGYSRQLRQTHVLRKDGRTFFKAGGLRGLGGPADQWMSTSSKEADQLASYCDLALGMPAELSTLTGVARSGQWVRDGSTRIGGVPAVILHFTTGDAVDELALDADPAGSSELRIAVAAEGEPHLLRVELASGSNRLTVRLRDHGAPVTVTPPPADQVHDFDAQLPEGEELPEG
ncbi:hypothetical protein [Kitasatospora griseola]|uniref:hypothetical protein n=1 Tax=Kitasatospora griseola TaxID=2064 RepID=UPI0034259505